MIKVLLKQTACRAKARCHIMQLCARDKTYSCGQIQPHIPLHIEDHHDPLLLLLFGCAGAAAGGLAACPQGGGDSLVHVGCSDGALTKMLASKGLRVCGVDADVAAATKRGLKCVAFEGQPLSQGSMAGAAVAAGEAVDVVLVYTAPHVSSSASGSSSSSSSSGSVVLGSKECLNPAALKEFGGLLKPGGRLCLEVPLSAGHDAAAVLTELLQQVSAAGFSAVKCLQVLPGVQQERVRLVAEWSGSAIHSL
jgi:SAM-dependent methyltransferase